MYFVTVSAPQVSQSVSFIAVPPRSLHTTVSKDGSARLGQHKY